jgi:RNA polymerase-binding transcription factor DksA
MPHDHQIRGAAERQSPKELAMIAIKNEDYFDELRKRRDKTAMTLEYVRKEQSIVDENTEWIDKAAYQSRRDLLDSLAEWYVDEATRIDDALVRITEGRHGICLGCLGVIEPRRLEALPEAAFCAECQRNREALTLS